MSPISQRHLLFIGIGFYDYEAMIVARLRALGAKLMVATDKPAALRDGLVAGLLNRSAAVARYLTRRHEQELLRRAATQHFEQVLIIKAVDLSVDFLRELRRQQPAAEFVLYQWDSIARLPGLAERLPFFDRVLTFDRPDSLANRHWQFRPLFYREAQSADATVSPSIDISFVGWLHSDRLAGVRKLQQQAHEQGLTTFVYLYTGFMTWLKLLLRGQAKDVHPKPISYREVMQINQRSRCVLDLPHALQAGLTMRAIETLGFKKKLITTGVDIVNYDFFRTDNIKVVAAGQWTIDRSFVLSPQAPIPESIRHRYSLDAWLAEVLEAPEQLQVQFRNRSYSAALGE